jgi:hypothetical protein
MDKSAKISKLTIPTFQIQAYRTHVSKSHHIIIKEHNREQYRKKYIIHPF